MSMEEQIAKEIVQMSDDEVIQNVKSIFLNLLQLPL